jgi:hypothetical protein
MPEPIRPVQDEVDEQLVAIMSEADAMGGARRLYFHFSGHGASSPEQSGDDVALLLAKWSKNLARLALSTDGYRSALSGLGVFDELVISLDCCRTTATRVVGLSPLLTLERRSQAAATRTFVAYATEAGRSAFEDEERELWQGVFTRALLGILRRATSGISAAELKRELEYVMSAKGQRAHVVNGLREESRFGSRGAAPKAKPNPKVVIVFERAKGRVRLRNGSRVVIAERDAGPEPWELELAAGLYKLEHDGGGKVTFEQGEECDGEEVLRVVF